MFTRIARLVAVSLPVLLACVLVTAGGWRIHDGHVERVSHTSASAAAPVAVSQQSAEPTAQVALVHHLSPSIPWPVWVALVMLCILPAVASTVAWSGTHRSRESTLSA